MPVSSPLSCIGLKADDGVASQHPVYDPAGEDTVQDQRPLSALRNFLSQIASRGTALASHPLQCW